MEHLPAYVTLREFIRGNGGCLTAETANRIMSQSLVATRHCMNKNYFYPLLKRLIPINPETLHIKYAYIGKKDYKEIKETNEIDEYFKLYTWECIRQNQFLGQLSRCGEGRMA
ncbi:hypothetical protein R3I94_002481 [Phoxinus phoxinus]